MIPEEDAALAAYHEWFRHVMALPQVSYYRMCSLTTECVLLLQNVFSYYRMCSLTTECVLSLQSVFSYERMRTTNGFACRPSPTLSPTDPVPRGLLTLCPWASAGKTRREISLLLRYVHIAWTLPYRMCSLPTECVLSLQNMFFFHIVWTLPGKERHLICSFFNF